MKAPADPSLPQAYAEMSRAQRDLVDRLKRAMDEEKAAEAILSGKTAAVHALTYDVLQLGVTVKHVAEVLGTSERKVGRIRDLVAQYRRNSTQYA